MIVLERLISVSIFLAFVIFIVTQLLLPFVFNTPLFPNLRGSKFRQRRREAQRRLEDVELAKETLHMEAQAKEALSDLPEAEVEEILKPTKR